MSHPRGKGESRRAPPRRWRWLAISCVGVLVLASVAFILVRASEPKALTIGEVLGAHNHAHALEVRVKGGVVELLLGTHQGLFTSRDDGRTWQAAKGDVADTDVMAFAGSPGGRVFYAGGHDIAVLRSLDGGGTWERADMGLPHHDVHVLAADPGEPMRAYSWVVGHGLFRTEDGGKSWTRVNAHLARAPVYCLHIPRGASGVLYAGIARGLHRSKDGGVSFERVPNALLNRQVLALLEVEGSPGRFIAGTEGGLYVSQESGASFERVEGGLIPLPVISLAQGGGSVYALTSAGGIYRSQDGGRRWVRLP